MKGPDKVVVVTGGANGIGHGFCRRFAQADARGISEIVIEALAEERYLILNHPEVDTCMKRKPSDYDRWLAGRRRLRKRHFDEQPLKERT